MQQVEVTSEGGKVTVKVKGVCGPACKNLTKEVEKLLGETKESKPTSEMYEQAKKSVKASY